MNLFSTDSVVALQNWPVPTALWKAITFLGNEEFFLLLMPFVYWCVDARLGLRLGILVLLCDAFNLVFKVLWALPRPYWLDSRVHPLALEASFGLPSSHAQNAAAVWPFLARQHSTSLARFAAGALIALISLSRVALGVHFPIDVLSGAAIGALFLGAFCVLEPRASALFARQSLVSQCAAATLVAATMVLTWWLAKSVSKPLHNFPTALDAAAAYSWEPIVSRAGALWGLGCGAALAQRQVSLEANAIGTRRLLRFVIGAVGVVLCWKGLAMIFPREPEPLALCFRFVRYALLTLWVTLGAPLLFARLGRLQKCRISGDTINAS